MTDDFEPIPEPHVKIDDHGRPIYRYTCSYRMAGDLWSFDLWAYSDEDARQRIIALRSSAKVGGRVEASFKRRGMDDD